jgi:two-component system, cell cycle response regulator CtrA
MRVLVIESDKLTTRSIELMLRAEGFNVFATHCGEDGIDLAKLYDYDLIVMELFLSDVSGFDVLRKLRVQNIKTPVLVLSGLADLQSKIRAFGLGADDYMTKPFHKDELTARATAIIRRAKGHARSLIEIGELTLDLDTKTAEVAGKPLHLTRKEWEMLELMALRKGATITKEMFLSHLYGGMDEPAAKIVDVFLCKLRRKLSKLTDRNYIETVWGRGYILRDTAAA